MPEMHADARRGVKVTRVVNLMESSIGKPLIRRNRCRETHEHAYGCVIGLLVIADLTKLDDERHTAA